jgi:hypothetical protein
MIEPSFPYHRGRPPNTKTPAAPAEQADRRRTSGPVPGAVLRLVLYHPVRRNSILSLNCPATRQVRLPSRRDTAFSLRFAAAPLCRSSRIVRHVPLSPGDICFRCFPQQGHPLRFSRIGQIHIIPEPNSNFFVKQAISAISCKGGMAMRRNRVVLMRRPSSCPCYLLRRPFATGRGSVSGTAFRFTPPSRKTALLPSGAGNITENDNNHSGFSWYS